MRSITDGVLVHACRWIRVFLRARGWVRSHRLRVRWVCELGGARAIPACWRRVALHCLRAVLRCCLRRASAAGSRAVVGGCLLCRRACLPCTSACLPCRRAALAYGRTALAHGRTALACIRVCPPCNSGDHPCRRAALLACGRVTLARRRRALRRGRATLARGCGLRRLAPVAALPRRPLVLRQTFAAPLRRARAVARALARAVSRAGLERAALGLALGPVGVHPPVARPVALAVTRRLGLVAAGARAAILVPLHRRPPAAIVLLS
ncbi:hypothetical protein T492DRAFT_979460 [Pavlovales sp. CCMP2436]|nr:hypothetical protein T492DRAFT_979460 [Pavlovales sp. CCMP2436]